MSRSHPGKRKPHTTRATALIVCEGFTEEAFCKHLKALYAHTCGVVVSLANARGGSPEDVVQLALNRRGYDRTIVFFDTDRPLSQRLRNRSLKAGHLHAISEPCVEGFFLALLNRQVPRTSDDCKRAVEALLGRQNKTEAKSYQTLFPKAYLDNCQHPTLSTLLSAFQPAA
jgi:hypothetical protein